ncbi:hypothetical protein GRI62_07465 [Erythrobacter arachoides]|uniref:Uncharacterized protein n=1 Tax=Aurantiacibacter arachoides TaxID=1850444 RepID=A0A844ZZ44_9SPHN|nr:hypothetical protein [Aurantiacibacter arachoides]MXO93443.1 hypothetical protein [Aurantiacibacter arachoides]GGD49351.1 hypothetical protein GCM10011411_06390 [Aurantiacibacter arachoides]
MQKNYRDGGVGLLDAAPGTYLVSAYFDDNQADLVTCNVLGWQVGKDRRLTPLTLDVRAVDEDPWFVVHPDGRVEASDGRGWDSRDAWLDDERRAQRLAA